MSVQSVMPSSHSFAQVPSADIRRSSFNRSSGFKTTLSAGDLVPFFVDEVLPGDTFNLRLSAFARLATPLKPFMDNLFFDTFFFFVPNRLVWSNWKKFCGEQINPGDSTSFLIPQVAAPAGGWLVGSLYDYFGVPTQVAGFSVNNLHGRAYNLIYNEWFRDENLQNSITVDLGDGPDVAANYIVRKRGKRHDYFTSALPWPQKGPSVSLPLGTNAPVRGTGGVPTFSTVGAGFTDRQFGTVDNAGQATATFFGGVGGSGQQIKFGSSTGLTTDLTLATAATINDLRQAASVQRLYERDARGGTRYTEIVLSHFRVKSPDARLQRPEYLGGGSSPINVNPIAQTSAANAQPTPQGNLAAMGTLNAQGHGFVKSFTEHGVIIGICNVRADLNYQQGLNRMWSRQSRFDFFWPDLDQLGEQTVLNKEIYTQGIAADNSVFGYQERFAEYRYKPSLITGQFRSNYATPLDFWHLAEYYTALPTLGNTWISNPPPMARVKAVTSEPDFLLDTYCHLICARPMAVYGVPGMTRF